MGELHILKNHGWLLTLNDDITVWCISNGEGMSSLIIYPQLKGYPAGVVADHREGFDLRDLPVNVKLNGVDPG